MSAIERRASIFYRTHGGENKNRRPPWYSKELCLQSMLIAVSLLRERLPTDFTVVHDGPMKQNPEWSRMLTQKVENEGIIVEKEKMGNSKSCAYVIHEAVKRPQEEIVIVAEDDYLWLAPAMIGLVNALTQLPADYATAYDHPVRYKPDYPLGADYPHWYTTIHITDERHWRSQESTCMTFATTAGVLQQDIEHFEKYQDNGKGSPEDRELFRELQGLGPYRYKRLDAPRLLLGPMPALATHAHLPWLAPLVDWDAVAQQLSAIIKPYRK